MGCIRGIAPLGLCVVLWICVWYVPTSAGEVKAMDLLHNDIDNHIDHVFDQDDTNFNLLRRKAHINQLKLKKPKKPGKDKKYEKYRKTSTTTTTITPPTTPTTTTEAATTTTEATTTTTITPPPPVPTTSNAITSTTPLALLSGTTAKTTPTPMSVAGTTSVDFENVTKVTSGVYADVTTPPGTERGSTAVTELAVRTTNAPKSISYNLFIKKVMVHVVYESLCPFSRKFIVSQLLPTYQKLRDHMHLVLLPFGNARVSKTRTVNPNFICPRGSAECRSNMIETCIIRSVRETLTAVHIIACMSRSGAPHRVARRCVEKKGLEWHLMERCVTTSGKEYMLDMAKKTWQIKKSVGHVPLVVIEGEQIYTKEAQRDLIGVICRRIPLIGICARRR